MSGVGVLDKAVVILAACVDGASLAELVDRTKLPRATAHRLAQALEIHRMLVRDTQGRWRPGPRLGELANAAPDVLLTAAEPLLGALRDATGESAQLYLRRADERICVAAAERASGLRDTVPVGAVLPMTAGSAAQILLAWEPPEAVMPLLPRCKFTGRTLAEVRRRGWARSRVWRVSRRRSGTVPVGSSPPFRSAARSSGSGGGPASGTRWRWYGPASACPAFKAGAVSRVSIRRCRARTRRGAGPALRAG
jgi:DNA-binding IclR family transcriptional regulator